VSTDALAWPEVWDDLRVPVTGTQTGGVQDPGFVTVPGSVFRTYGFSPILPEELFLVAQLPHRYSTGTELRPHVHWGSSGTTGTVRWQLDYAIQRAGRILSTGTMAGTEAAPGLSTDGIPLVEITGLATSTGGRIDGAAVPPSAMILGRVVRTATGDTYAGDAYLFELDFHFVVGHDGTTAEYPT
jgi:hypothetical protein